GDHAKMPAALGELGSLLTCSTPWGRKTASSRDRRWPTSAVTCAGQSQVRPPVTARWVLTPKVGNDSRKASRWRWHAAASEATCPLFTTRRAPTSKPPGRSSASWKTPRSASAWTPGTCSSAAAIRCERSANGAAGSITFTSRMRAGRWSKESCGKRRRFRKSGGERRSAAWVKEISTSTRSWRRSETPTRDGSWSSKTCCRTQTGRRRRTSARTVSTWPRGGSKRLSAFRFGLAGRGRMGRNHLRALGGSAEVEVAAIAEPSEATRRYLGPTVATDHEDLDSMLESGLDAVLVCVHNDLYSETHSHLSAAV